MKTSLKTPPPSAVARTYTVRQENTLLPFIMTTLNGIHRNKAKAILTSGSVQVEGKIVRRHDFPLTPGMKVAIRRSAPREELRNPYVRVVYEDAAIMVVEKKVGILSMASAHHAFSVKSVLDDYLHRTGQKCTAHVVHRLDRDTSGLLVYAKTMQAEQVLEHNWHTIVTDRRYIALVSGELTPTVGKVESWLKDNKSYFTLSYPQDPGGGKFAVTHYRVLRTDGKHSIVELRLETGRKNQIRVHLQGLGHPVCGDIKYGNGDDPIGRLALHAFRLNFYHPITGEPLHFETPLPKSFLRGIEKGKTQSATRGDARESSNA